MKIQLLVDGKLRTVLLDDAEPAGAVRAELDGQPVEFEAAFVRPGLVSLIMRSGPLAGRAFQCLLEQDASGVNGKTVRVNHEPPIAYKVHDPRSFNARERKTGQAEGAFPLKANMAGRVVRLLVEKGDAIEAQDGIVVIEAMKMQNEIRSGRAGTVTELRVALGEMVSAGQVLAVVTS